MSKKTPNKSIYPVIKNEHLVTRHEQLVGKCPVETTNERLSAIEEGKPLPKKKLKKQAPPSKCLDYWLQPGISIPKFQEKSTISLPEAGEPSVGGYETPISKTPSFSYRGSISSIRKELEDVQNYHPKDYETRVYEEAVGPSRCQFLFRVPSDELIFDGFQDVKEEEHIPSHALENWESWMKERKNLHEVFGEKLYREPCELVMNRAENLRKMNEDKEMYVYSQFSKPDKWRGDPFYWKTPIKLPTRDEDCESECRNYFVVQTKWEKGIVPSLECVGVPKIIQKEKGLLCDPPLNINSITSFWKRSLYRKKQYGRFMKQRNMLQPHHIELDELAVVGNKIPSHKEKIQLHQNNPNIPKIKINDVDVICENYDEYDIYPCDERHLYPYDNIACLAIMNEEIRIDLLHKRREHKGKKFWTIDFGVNPAGTFTEKIFRIENRGTVTINYRWTLKKKKVPQFNLEKTSPAYHEPWFFFDKNPGTFLPGQIYEIKFYLHCVKAGVRTETWFLKTTPHLFKNRDGAKVLLTAVATDDSSKKELQRVENYVTNRVGVTIARNIIHDIVFDLIQPHYKLRGLEYRSLFLEPYLFEYHNPKFYYDSELVDELKQIFVAIPQYKQPEWDLSIDSLVKLLRKNAGKKQYYNLLQKISIIAKELFHPKFVSEQKNEKYRMSYQVLCRMINYIDDDYIKTISCFPQKISYSKDKSVTIDSEYLEGEEFSETEISEERDAEKITSEEKDVDSKSFDLQKVENSHLSKGNFYNMNTINFVHFQTLFYLKVYERVCRAAEQIAGIIESRKLFEPWKKINYSPPRRFQH